MKAGAISHHPSVRPVLTVPAQEELAAVTLDSDIWAASPGSLPDIRFADAAGVPIPHLLQKAAEQRLRTIRDNCRSRVDTLQELPENRIELTVTLDEKSPFTTGIEFVTPLQDFERQITVQGIDTNGIAGRKPSIRCHSALAPRTLIPFTVNPAGPWPDWSAAGRSSLVPSSS